MAGWISSKTMRTLLGMRVMAGVLLMSQLGLNGCRSISQKLATAAGPDTEMVVLGHRGHSIAHPENSLSSLRSALEKTAGAEIDIQITKDDRIVVLHDDTLERTAKDYFTGPKNLLTTPIDQLNWHEIKEVAIGPQDRLPTLEEVLDLYLKEENLQKTLLIEVKSYGSSHAPLQKKMVSALHRLFSQKRYQNLLSRMPFISFDQEILHLLNKSFPPPLSTYWIVESHTIQDPDKWPKLLKAIDSFTGIDLESHTNLLQKNSQNKTFIELAKAEDKKVITWVSRAKRTDGFAFRHLSAQSGVDYFTSDLDLSVWDRRLTQKRIQEAATLIPGDFKFTPGSPFLTNPQGEVLAVYTPIGEILPHPAVIAESVQKDLHHLNQMADLKGILFNIGDLEPEQITKLLDHRKSRPELWRNVQVMTTDHLPTQGIDGIAAYEKRLSEKTTLKPYCI